MLVYARAGLSVDVLQLVISLINDIRLRHLIEESNIVIPWQGTSKGRMSLIVCFSSFRS